MAFNYNMEDRNELVSSIGDLLYSLPKSELRNIYWILEKITRYVDTHDEVQKAQILSVIRNISSNVIMIHQLRDDQYENESKE